MAAAKNKPKHRVIFRIWSWNHSQRQRVTIGSNQYAHCTRNNNRNKSIQNLVQMTIIAPTVPAAVSASNDVPDEPRTVAHHRTSNMPCGLSSPSTIQLIWEVTSRYTILIYSQATYRISNETKNDEQKQKYRNWWLEHWRLPTDTY